MAHANAAEESLVRCLQRCGQGEEHQQGMGRHRRTRISEKPSPPVMGKRWGLGSSYRCQRGTV